MKKYPLRRSVIVGFLFSSAAWAISSLSGSPFYRCYVRCGPNPAGGNEYRFCVNVAGIIARRNGRQGVFGHCRRGKHGRPPWRLAGRIPWIYVRQFHRVFFGYMGHVARFQPMVHRSAVEKYPESKENGPGEIRIKPPYRTEPLIWQNKKIRGKGRAFPVRTMNGRQGPKIGCRAFRENFPYSRRRHPVVFDGCRTLAAYPVRQSR
jgi:hypothetical protein